MYSSRQQQVSSSADVLFPSKHINNKAVRDKKYDMAHPVILFSWLTNFSQLSKGNFIIDLVTKGQKISKANYGVLNSSKKRTILTKYPELSREDAQYSEFRSFFGRIEETINCFRDLLTFSTHWNLYLYQLSTSMQNFYHLCTPGPCVTVLLVLWNSC